MNTDDYNAMRARLYMSQHPDATFEQALEEVMKPYVRPIEPRFSDPAYLKAERNVARSQKAIRRAV